MPCRVGDCRFSQAETAAFNAMWDSEHLSGNKLTALVDARLKAVGSPSSIDQSTHVTFSGGAERHNALLGQNVG